MKRHSIVIAFAVLSPLLGGCYGLYGNDEFERYAQRKDSVTLDAGNAKNANAVTQMLTPWPPGVSDRRIISDAHRVAPAVDRYRQRHQSTSTVATGAPTGAPVAAAADMQGR